MDKVKLYDYITSLHCIWRYQQNKRAQYPLQAVQTLVSAGYLVFRSMVFLGRLPVGRPARPLGTAPETYAESPFRLSPAGRKFEHSPRLNLSATSARTLTTM